MMFLLLMRRIIARGATQYVAWPLIILALPVGGLEDGKMNEQKFGGWITIKPLLFNDAESGKVFEIPVGEPCLLVESVEDAKRRGLLTGEQEIWAAKVNLQRGYSLVFIRGKVRGLMPQDFGRS